MSRGRRCPPYRVGWDPEYLEEWSDKRLTWPTWEYDKKPEAIADAKFASRHVRMPIVVYDGRLNIIKRFEPREEAYHPFHNKELIERLRKEMVSA
jgi:hypothetical protein